MIFRWRSLMSNIYSVSLRIVHGRKNRGFAAFMCQRLSVGIGSLLTAEHTARRLDVLAARRSDCRRHAELVQAVAEAFHDRHRSRRMLEAGDGMETDQVHAAVETAEQSGERIGVAQIIVDTAPDDIFGRQSTLVGKIISAEKLHDPRDRKRSFDGHQLLAFGRERRVDTDSHMHLCLVEQSAESIELTDARHRDALRTPREPPRSSQHLDGFQHLVDVIHRLAHAHKHEIRQRLALGDRENLVDDTRSREIAVETLSSRHAKTAAHLAARLRRNAERSAVTVRDIDRLHVATASTARQEIEILAARSKQIFHRPVRRARLLDRSLQPDAIMLVKPLASLLRQLRHLIDAADAVDIQAAGNLFGGKLAQPRLLDHRFEFRESHSEQRTPLQSIVIFHN